MLDPAGRPSNKFATRKGVMGQTVAGGGAV